MTRAPVYPWLPEQIAQAAKMWNETDLSGSEIGRRIGCPSRATVARFAKQNPDVFKPRENARNQFTDYDRLRQYARCGMTKRDAAKKLGVGYKTICRHADRLGIKFATKKSGAGGWIAKPWRKPIPMGQGYNLKYGGSYLHMGGKSLTKRAGLAWRGREEQIEPMRRESGFDGLTAVQERQPVKYARGTI